MSSEPSIISGLKNEIVGVAKENIGWALGNKEMEHEGKIAREQGYMELEAARAEWKATGFGGFSFGADSGIDMTNVFADIRGKNYNLRKTQTSDKSCPSIDKQFKLRQAVDRKPIFADIRNRNFQLKHVETLERPFYFEQGFKLRTGGGRQSYLADIRKAGWSLRKASTSDRSAPSFDRIDKVKLPGGLLKDISGDKADLKHVETCDKSAPCIDGSVKLQMFDRKPFLSEVEQGADLKHVETCDKSGLNLPKGFHMTTPVDSH